MPKAKKTQTTKEKNEALVRKSLLEMTQNMGENFIGINNDNEKEQRNIPEIIHPDKTEVYSDKMSQEDKLSHDKVSHEEMSHDKVADEKIKESSENTDNKDSKEIKEQIEKSLGLDKVSHDKVSHEEMSHDKMASSDKMTSQKTPENEELLRQSVTYDKVSQEKNKEDFQENRPQDIDRHFLLMKSLTDYCLKLDIKPNAKLLLIHFLTTGIVDAEFLQEDLSKKIGTSLRTLLRTLQDLEKAGYIIKANPQPHRGTHITLKPTLEKYLMDNDVFQYDEIIEPLKNYLEATPICCGLNTEIGVGFQQNFSYDKMTQETTVMLSRLGLSSITYNTTPSSDKMTQQTLERKNREVIKITSLQKHILFYTYFWSYLYDFDHSKISEEIFDDVAGYLKELTLKTNIGFDTLSPLEKAMIHTGYNSLFGKKDVRYAWNYFRKVLKEENYKAFFTQEVSEKYMHIRKYFGELKEKKYEIIKNELLMQGVEPITEYLKLFRFGYLVPKREKINMEEAVDKIAQKLKLVQEQFNKFCLAFKIEQMTHFEEFKYPGKLQKNSSN